jgi:predicted nucleic acid-binding protein
LISFDSNILVCAADPAAGERNVRSADLVARAMQRRICTQALQSLCEFYNVITRKAGVEASEAAALVAAWSAAMAIEYPRLEDLDAAMRAVRDHGLSFWDAMLWATVRRAGVRLLITEDFQDGRTIEGVRVVNPFAPDNRAIIEHALG